MSHYTSRGGAGGGDARPSTAGIKSEVQHTRKTGKRLTQAGIAARRGHSILEWDTSGDGGDGFGQSPSPRPRGDPYSPSGNGGGNGGTEGGARGGGGRGHGGGGGGGGGGDGSPDDDEAAVWAGVSPLSTLVMATGNLEEARRLAAEQQRLRAEQLMLQRQQEEADAQLAAALRESLRDLERAPSPAPHPARAALSRHPQHGDSLQDLLAAAGHASGPGGAAGGIGERPPSSSSHSSRRGSDSAIRNAGQAIGRTLGEATGPTRLGGEHAEQRAGHPPRYPAGHRSADDAPSGAQAPLSPARASVPAATTGSPGAAAHEAAVSAAKLRAQAHGHHGGGGAAGSPGLNDTPLLQADVRNVPLSQLVNELERLQASVVPGPKHGRRKLGGGNMATLPKPAYAQASGSNGDAGSGTGGGAPAGGMHVVTEASHDVARSLKFHTGARVVNTQNLASGLAAAADIGARPPSGGGGGRGAAGAGAGFGDPSNGDEGLGGGALVSPMAAAPAPAPVSPGSVQDAMLAEITGPRAAVVQLMCWRTAQIRVARNMWERQGASQALSHVISTANDGVAVDFLNGVVRRGVGFPKWPASKLKWVELLVPFLRKLLESNYEDYLVCALASVKAVLQACSPLIHEVCAEQESKPSVPSWAQGGVMDKPKKKSDDFIIKEGRVVDLVEVMASLRRPLEGVYKHRGNVAEQAKRCIHTLRQLLRGAASCGLL